MHDFYIQKESKLIKFYEKLTKRAKKILEKCYSPEKVERIIDYTKKEYYEIIARLPYIGGKENKMTVILEFNGWVISFHKAMREAGIEPCVSAYVSRQIFYDMFNKVPKFLGVLIGRLTFTKKGEKYFKKQAAVSQQRRYPEDFIYSVNVNRGKSKEVEVAFEFEECAVHKFYEAEDVEELKAYCNFADPIYSDRFEMGINADETLAHGCKTCKLIYNNKRKTHTPENVKNMIREAEEIMSYSKTSQS